MKKSILMLLLPVLSLAVAPHLASATPVTVNQVVFLEYFGANGPALGGFYTGEYNFHTYSAIQSGGNLTSGNFLGDISVWCLTPFAETRTGKVPFALGNATDLGQLHDVPGITDAEADSFYRDTTAMYLDYYTLGSASLHDDLQAVIWERRDMIEGPSGTKSVNTFNLLNGNYNLGSSIPSSISSNNLFSAFIGLSSGPIGSIYTPIKPGAVTSGDILSGGYQYDYDHGKQEFGYVTTAPEPSSLILLASGLLAAAGFYRRSRQR